MRAVYAQSQDEADPLRGLVIGELTPAEPPPGWVRVRVRAAALNHHDLWSLRGVGLPADRLPMVLGTDAVGVTDDGVDVLVHAVISSESWLGDETLDPDRTLLSELHPGTLAEHVWAPERNLVPLDPAIELEAGACLPTAWLTAYRLLFTAARVAPGQTVLVQGAGGGVSTAAITLARAAGLRVWATSRDAEKAERARSIGAHEVFEQGERLPAKVDVVIETVGEATWSHSVRSLVPGGVIAVAGATSGAAPSAQLSRVFFRSLRVVGSTMGTRAELERLQAMLVATGVRPAVSRVAPIEEARSAMEDLRDGRHFGKIVLTID